MFVLTSRPIPPDVPADVVVADPRPQGLLERLPAAGLTRDAFLRGGRSTLDAFLELGGIDRLEAPRAPHRARGRRPVLAVRLAAAAAGTRGALRLLRRDDPPRVPRGRLVEDSQV